MNCEKLGILGGMGTAAGIYFAQKLVELNTRVEQDADHAPFILYSDPTIPHRGNAYLHSGPSPAPALVASLHKLSTLGADFAVMICNTAHIYFDEIAAQTKLPLINMIETAADYAAQRLAGKKIGLLATKATARSGLYSGYFAETGVEVVLPGEADQELIQAVIFDRSYGLKVTGMSGSPTALKTIREVAGRMRASSGIDHLLLGCTELSFGIPEQQWGGFHIVDPVQLLALRCLQRVRPEAGPA